MVTGSSLPVCSSLHNTAEPENLIKVYIANANKAIPMSLLQTTGEKRSPSLTLTKLSKESLVSNGLITFTYGIVEMYNDI